MDFGWIYARTNTDHEQFLRTNADRRQLLLRRTASAASVHTWTISQVDFCALSCTRFCRSDSYWLVSGGRPSESSLLLSRFFPV